MALTQPVTDIDARFSSPEAAAVPWDIATSNLADAEIFWLSTVRADGRPHVAPLIAVWLDGALHFCTGIDEQKARNIEANPRCVLTTGRNSLSEETLDIVVEGEARRVTDPDTLQRIADRYVEKYGEDWRFDVHDGGFRHSADTPREDHPSVALVFAVAPVAAFGFARGQAFGQTRWTF